MVIELYGLPGAGKTTIIKEITAGNATTISGITGIKGKIISILKKLVVYFPSSIKYKYMMRQIINMDYAEPIYTSTSLTRHLNNIVLVVFGYRKIKKTIYMDEGLIHRLITLAVNFNLSDEKLFALIDLIYLRIDKVQSFFLDVPIKESFESIKARNRHEYEMDELCDECLLEFLIQYDHFCKVVCDKYGHAVVRRNDFEAVRMNE